MKRSSRLTVRTAAIVLAAAGCATRPVIPVQLAIPTSETTIDYFLGTAISGPVAGAVPVAIPTDSLSVRVTFIALENPPATSLPPVGSSAISFSSSGSGDALLPAAELTRDAAFASLSPDQNLWTILQQGHAGRVTSMPTQTAALPAGVTAGFAVLDPTPIVDPVTAASAHRTVRVLISRPVDPASPRQLALVVRDFLPVKDGPPALRTETDLFDLPAGDKISVVLTLPFAFDRTQTRALAIAVDIAPGTDDPAHTADTAACVKAVAASLPTTQPDQATGETSDWSTVTAAIQSLSAPAGRRGALAFLADQTAAPLCEDVAMEADDAVLSKLVEAIQTKVPVGSPPQSRANVGWMLDQISLQLLARMQDDAANGTGKFPPEMSAILSTRTGEVGRHSSSLEEVLRNLTGRQELDNRLLAQNMIFLEDSSPAARVRAYDWLDARHQAPAGYDPLAPGKSRREALEKAAGAQ